MAGKRAQPGEMHGNAKDMGLPDEGAAQRMDELEDFFENGAIALHIVGGDGTILRANAAELEMLGYCAEDYIGRHIAEFHVDEPVIEDILARLTRGETIRRYPARLRARDGAIRHVEITSSGQFSEGNFVNTRCFTIDVTDLVEARMEARRKDNHLRRVLDALPAAVFMVDADGTLTYVNKAAHSLEQRAPNLGEDDWNSIFPLFRADGAQVAKDERPMAKALREGRPIWGAELMARRTDGTLLPVMVFPTPISDDSGNLTGAVNMFVDISERKQAEEMFRLAVDAAPSGMILTDAEGRILLANSEAEALFGYPHTDMIGQSVEFLIPEQHRDAHTTLREAFARAPKLRGMDTGRELVALRKDGVSVPVEIGLSPLETSQGLMVLCTIVDITERRRVAEREKLLLRELHHRSSNVFSVVQAIAAHSLSTNVPVKVAKQVLSARLQAMARTHRLLIEGSWHGLDLNAVVRGELAPFSDRVRIEGRDVMLEPGDAQNFSLALHELTTNALKYGALSVPDGHVEIRWTVTRTEQGQMLHFDWQERDGPPVAVPSRQGFGSSLLKNVFAETSIDYAADGLSCRIELQLGEAVDPQAGDHSEGMNRTLG